MEMAVSTPTLRLRQEAGTNQRGGIMIEQD